MLNKSIAYRLSVYISLAVISVFIAFIAIYFMFNHAMIKDNVQSKAIGLSSEIIGNVERHVVATKEVSNNIAEQIYYYLEHGHSEEFISTLLKKYGFINAIHINVDIKDEDIAYHNYYAFRNNDSVSVVKANERFATCVTKEAAYKKLLNNRLIDWSEPMICRRNNEFVVSHYSPIIKSFEGKTIQVGEVVCELSLKELNASINNIKIGDRGYAFLISREGYFITHPNENLIFKNNVRDIPPEIVKGDMSKIMEVLAEGEAGSVIAFPEHLNNEKAWVYYTPVEEIGWTLVFILPYHELYEPLYLPVLQMLFFSVLGILVIYLLVTYITNKQIEPLSSVTQQLKRFSSLDGDISEISKNEIQQVSESLNYMKSWYEKYKLTQHEEAQKSKTRKRDLGQASEIQQSFIKTNFPVFPDRTEIDLFAIYKPARGVSGDLFDFFFVDEEHLVITMGDVSGKGIPAAFFMSVAQTVIKINGTVNSASEIVKNANNELFTNNQHQFFLTLFLGVLNVRSGMFRYCNAAHTAPYILSVNGQLNSLAQSHGLPLGLYPDKNYNEAEMQLQAGDSIVLYTDGVNEQCDKDNSQYGTERLEQNLKSLSGLEPKEIVLKVHKSIELFAGKAPQTDDVSILTLCYKGL